jgi:hypothetical protein
MRSAPSPRKPIPAGADGCRERVSRPYGGRRGAGGGLDIQTRSGGRAQVLAPRTLRPEPRRDPHPPHRFRPAGPNRFDPVRRDHRRSGADRLLYGAAGAAQGDQPVDGRLFHGGLPDAVEPDQRDCDGGVQGAARSQPRLRPLPVPDARRAHRGQTPAAAGGPAHSQDGLLAQRLDLLRPFTLASVPFRNSAFGRALYRATARIDRLAALIPGLRWQFWSALIILRK